MLAAIKDHVIEQGITFSWDFDWVDSSGAAVDVTGFDFRIKIKATYESASALIEGSYDGATNTPTGNIVIAETGSGGNVSFLISATNTAALDFTQAVYDIEAEDSSGIVYRCFKGKVTLDKEATD